jgi:hypothetical protein
MASPATIPGFDAVPGLMTPGLAWPGGPLESLVTPGPVIFTLDIPHSGWQAGGPYGRWKPGNPYLAPGGAG